MALAPPMVMVDVSARATISIISWDDSTATAGAMRKSDGLSRLSVPSHVAVATEGQAIRHVVAELGMIPVGENVMCSQALLTLGHLRPQSRQVKSSRESTALRQA